MQLDELKQMKTSAFNWSDEELLGDADDMRDVIYKDKYRKKKSRAASGNAYSHIKQTVQRGYSQAKAGISSKYEMTSIALAETDPLSGQKTHLKQLSQADRQALSEETRSSVKRI